MQLSKKILPLLNNGIAEIPEASYFELPEKVLQFGTGVLLRGLPDYYIDQANKKGFFNGRIVIVKSTDGGDANAFDEQDCLFTQYIRGVVHEEVTEKYIINASVSRVLSARDEWNQILDCAANPDLSIVISNTTEIGIVLLDTDDIKAAPPISFPGKLLAFLYERYKAFDGSEEKGLVIVPTELITENGNKLLSIVIELAHLNQLDYAFIDWLENANQFCNTLVDRIVPGKLPAAQQKLAEEKLGYTDDLMIMSEVYSLWAIESASPKVKEVLSFAKSNPEVVITSSIKKHRELKLRLLNGTHTFSCGLAHLAGFKTVKEAMENKTMCSYVYNLMMQEIVLCIAEEDLTVEEAQEFSMRVIDRFSNPFIDHQWLSIIMQYTHKMKMRNIPLLLKHYQHDIIAPRYMALGFAAYLLTMKSEPGESGIYYGEVNGTVYPIQDEQAAYFQKLWKDHTLDEVVTITLSNETLWGSDLTTLPGFKETVEQYLESLIQHGTIATLKEYKLNREKVTSHEA